MGTKEGVMERLTWMSDSRFFMMEMKSLVSPSVRVIAFLPSAASAMVDGLLVVGVRVRREYVLSGSREVVVS